MQAVITAGNDVAIQVSEIPPHELTYFASETLHAVERFFAVPGVQKDYEKWLIEYRKRKKAQK